MTIGIQLEDYRNCSIAVDSTSASLKSLLLDIESLEKILKKTNLSKDKELELINKCESIKEVVRTTIPQRLNPIKTVFSYKIQKKS